VERFMGDYYRHARSMAKTREMILQRAKPPPRRPPREIPAGRGLKVTRDAVSLVDPDALESDPALALRLYDEAIRRDLPVYDFARHAVARAVDSEQFCEKLRSYDIVKAHGGELKVETKEGEGSKFTIYLNFQKRI
jgi:hypothetical protein